MKVITRIVRVVEWETTEQTEKNYAEYCEDCRENNEEPESFTSWITGFVDEFGDDYDELTSKWGCALEWTSDDDENAREVTFLKK